MAEYFRYFLYVLLLIHISELNFHSPFGDPGPIIDIKACLFVVPVDNILFICCMSAIKTTMF